ncbi:MAG: M28 family peptidase [Planctomycetota bacterium]
MKLSPLGLSLLLLLGGGSGDRPDAAIRPDRFLEHVRWLAADDLEGRATGSKGQKEAAARIAAAFRKAGLEPVGEGGAYLQPFAVETRPRLVPGPGCVAVLRAEGKEAKFEPPVGLVPLPPSANGEVEGGLVFVGYAIADGGLGYDDFAGVDCKGKVALALRHTPQETNRESKFEPVRSRVGSFAAKARAAAAAGAVALLVVHDPLNHPDDSRAGLAAGGGGRAPIPAAQLSRRPLLEFLEGRGFDLLEEQKRIDEALAPRSRAIEGVNAEVKVEIRREAGTSLPTENVAGLLRGGDATLSKEVVVLGAHYDHVGRGEGPQGEGEIHNGADDNASGTSGLLCVAEALAGAPRPRRSILFLAFSGEEIGLRGSRHYCEHPLLPLADTVAMVNLDMIGRLGEEGCEVEGVGTAKGLEEAIEAENAGIGLPLTFTPGVTADSDHFPFHEKRTPVAFFFTGFHADYHRPGDDWEKVNAEGGALVARLACRTVLSLANAETRPAYSDPPRPRPRRERERGRRTGGPGQATLGATV